MEKEIFRMQERQWLWRWLMSPDSKHRVISWPRPNSLKVPTQESPLVNTHRIVICYRLATLTYLPTIRCFEKQLTIRKEFCGHAQNLFQLPRSSHPQLPFWRSDLRIQHVTDTTLSRYSTNTTKRGGSDTESLRPPAINNQFSEPYIKTTFRLLYKLL